MSESSRVFHAIRTLWHGGICMSRQLGGGGLAPEFPMKEHLLVSFWVAVLVVVLSEATELNLPEPENRSVSDVLHCSHAIKLLPDLISKHFFPQIFLRVHAPRPLEGEHALNVLHALCVCNLTSLNYPLCHCFSWGPLPCYAPAMQYLYKLSKKISIIAVVLTVGLQVNAFVPLKEEIIENFFCVLKCAQ